MFKSIAAYLPDDPDYPARQRTMELRYRVVTGTFYDLLPYEFHEEKNSSGEYVPLRLRAPSARYGLCRSVVDETVAMTFGEGRFPVIACEDEATRDSIATIVNEFGLVSVMREAALLGSCGSVAIIVRILSKRPYFEAMRTEYLTPVWKTQAPDQLARIRERYKVTGKMLVDAGYDVKADDTEWWFQREWTETEELWYLPLSKSDFSSKKPFQKDIAKSVEHGLGFVPLVWIKNLPGGTGIDGECTFRLAIETGIEIDYQLSQAGRGLKYSSDPTLLIKEPASADDQIVRGAATAIVVSEKGDARMLEINGTAAQAVIDFVRALREFALETVHGNRTSADKISGAQSGRAMEMMHQALINLVDQLRDSYGANGLLKLMRMVVKASESFPLEFEGQSLALAQGQRISLQWPPYFQMTQSDMQEEATTLSTLRTAGLISQESGVKAICETQDIADPAAELTRIKQDEKDQDKRLAAQAAATQAKETVNG